MPHLEQSHSAYPGRLGSNLLVRCIPAQLLDCLSNDGHCMINSCNICIFDSSAFAAALHIVESALEAAVLIYDLLQRYIL